MAEHEQIELYKQRSNNCIVIDHIDDDDSHCSNFDMQKSGYAVIDENHPDVDLWLQEIDGLSLNTVVSSAAFMEKLPQNYIPVIPRHSGVILSKYEPPYIAVRLSDVVSQVNLNVIGSLERFKTSPDTKVILLCYGKDKLIEDIWPVRHLIFPEIAKLGFAAVTSVNYSVWDEQPHLERAINVKRSLKTYEEMQKIGIPVVPHMYWLGYKSLDNWLYWLSANKQVNTLAICMQTLRSKKDWQRAIKELTYFTENLERPIHFLITGASKPARIKQLKEIMPQMTLTNGSASRLALAHQSIMEYGTGTAQYVDQDRSVTFEHNVEHFQKHMGCLDNKQELIVSTNPGYKITQNIVLNKPAKISTGKYGKILREDLVQRE